jgi:CheY-like chemotaxis protein
MDVLMPEMSGLTALRRLKEEKTTARIPVIVVTVNADRTTHLESEVSGAAAFLPKPFRPAELLGTLEHLIQAQKGSNSSSASPRVEPGPAT